MDSLLQNRYEILEKIGEGGMATVFKARCTLLDRIVAIKFLKEEYVSDTTLVAKFRSEAQAAARLSHPNIVNVFDVGEDHGTNFIVMEYIDGMNLKDYIKQKGPLSAAETVKIASMICEGLGHAHEKGLIHRDIKPHNIMFADNGTIKVADFGIARAAASATITYSGNMVGSVHYVSPEQARGEPVSAASDIYSLGCVIYEMVTGKVPFDAESPVTVALKHIHEMPIAPSIVNPEVPKALEAVIMTAMEKKPAFRYQSCQEMNQALLESVSGRIKKPFRNKKTMSDQTIVMPSLGNDTVPSPGRQKKMRPMGLVITAVVAFGLIAGILFSLQGNWFGQEVDVPSIVGMSFKEGAEVLAEYNLEMKVVNRIHSEVEKDHIISQFPEAARNVKEGREIEVVLSLGGESVIIPNAVGKTLQDATLIIESEGLVLGTVSQVYDPSVSVGIVLSQSPERGEKAQVGDAVNITVCGEKVEAGDINMPGLVGMNLDEAKAKLKANGLVLAASDPQENEKFFAGQIITQSPLAGKTVKRGDSVNLVVSKGPGPLPKTKDIRFTLPGDEESAQLSVVLVDSRGRREIYNNSHPGGYTFSRQVEYYGEGTVYFIVNGIEAERQLIK